MNKRFARIGARGMLAAFSLSLAACGALNDTTHQGLQSERLAPCTSDGSIFADMPFSEWKDRYHENVQDVIEAHMESLSSTTELPLQCTADDYEELVPASEPLREMAAGLPAYRDAENLSETDMAPVLLEFLRVYECSMKQQEEYAVVYIPREFASGGFMGLGNYLSKKAEQKQTMQDELRVSRTALERTLGLIGGYDRLRPLALDIECIKRASLDLRNVLGLAADASACLPRTWDTHGSLRDLAE